MGDATTCRSRRAVPPRTSRRRSSRAGSRHWSAAGAEDQLRRSRHVLPGDGEPQGDGAAIRLRTPAHTAEAQHDLARGEVDVQQGVLGDGAPGSDPRGTADGAEEATDERADHTNARPEGPVVSAADREDGAGDQGAAVRRPDRGPRHRSRDRSPTSRRGATTTGNELVEQSEADAVYRFVIRKK